MKRFICLFVSLVMVTFLLMPVNLYAEASLDITATPVAGQNYIALNWTNLGPGYTYTVYAKGQEENIYQSIPSKSDTIKVLNIYPYVGNSLKTWMETNGYGKDFISVDTVNIGDFNNSPESYMKDTNGYWKYNVIYFGAYDCNNNQDLSAASRNLVETYIKDGYGVLFGHDTMTGIFYHPNFNSLANYVNISLNTSNTYGNSTINVSKEGLLTNYPWQVGGKGTILTVPTTHTYGQFAMGDIWMNYTSNNWSGSSEITSLDGKTGSTNFYLTSWNNCAMIQTGHSNGAATEDEQKLLANTLFYLAQLTNGTSCNDHKSQDFAAPESVSINSVSNESKSLNATFTQPVDNGTQYEYYVKASKRDNEDITSSTASAINTSGIAGYSYVIDNTADTEPDNKIDTTNLSVSMPLSQLNLAQPIYIHIKAMDCAGNSSKTTHYKYKYTDKLELSQSSMILKKGNGKQLNPTVTSYFYTNADVKWTSSNEKVAAVDSKGNVTAVDAGKATITAQINGTDTSVTCEVDVKDISLDKTSITLGQPGEIQQLTATESENVVWTSSDEKVATVDSYGNVKAVGLGKAIIKAQIGGTDVSATCEAAVVDKTAPSIGVIEPADGSTLGPDANINVKASDNFAVSSIKLQYSLDGTEWKEIGKQNTSGNAAFNFDASSLKGNIKVKAVATDTSGNESIDSPIRTYAIDTTGPAKVENLTASTPSAVGVTLHWKDVPDQDFSYFQVEQKDGADGSYKAAGTTSTTLGMNITGLKPGITYLFRVTAWDKYGNKGIPSDEIQVTTAIDKTAPVITSILPKPARFKELIQLSAEVKDDIGASSLVFQKSYDKVNWTDITTVNAINIQTDSVFRYDFDVSKEPEGVMAVRAIAYDSIGNKSGSETSYIEYYIDHTAPGKTILPMISSSVSDITLSWQKATEQDLSHYRVYRSEGSENNYTLVKDGLSSLYYIDSNVYQGKIYYYKVSSVDLAGNESELSDSVKAMLAEDNERPKILSISEPNNSTLPANPSIRVLVSDNYKVSTVTMEYQADGKWNKIGDVALNSKGDVAAFTWNTQGLNEGSYKVKVTAVDASGNHNEAVPLIVNYSLNLLSPRTPILSAIPDNWKVQLSWTSGNETDLGGFIIYRSQTAGEGYQYIGQVSSSERSWSDGQVKPRTTYYYKIQAVDTYRNFSSLSNEVSAMPLSVDTYLPSAEAGDDQQTIKGMAVQFDGTKSTDNDAIASYLWDFGDGQTSTLAKPVHTYANKGEYTVKLSVSDYADNTASDTLKVSVLDSSESGILQVKVLDDSTGNAIPGASVVVKFSDGTEMKYFADSQGFVKLIGKTGTCTAYAFMTDYKPIQVDGEIKDSGSNITVRLVKGKLIDGKLTVTRMKLDDIVAAGIDVNSPENQWVYKFEAHLAFTDTPVTVPPIVVNGYGGLISGYAPFEITTSSSSGGTSTSYVYPYVVPQPKHPEVAPNVYYLVIPGEARWLKEFFEVGLLMTNTSDPSTPFAVTNSQATLNVPDGLTFMPTVYSNSTTIDTGTLNPGESKEVKWVVRGDKKGMYNLDADFKGILQPFNDNVNANFKTQTPFRVWGDDAVKLHIQAQDRADKGCPYHARFGIENISDIPLYNVSIALKDDAKQNYIYAPDQKLENTITELPAGKTVWLDSWLIPSITGTLELDKSYVLKTGSNEVKVVSDITSFAEPQNYPGTAPVLNQTHNPDGTVTLSWGAVAGATGYRIYYIRGDLKMSGEAEKVSEVDASKTSITLPESDNTREYMVTTLTPEGEVLKHAIKEFRWCDGAGNPVITVDPMEITVDKANNIVVTVNKQGYPVKQGTVDVGSYVKGQILDDNGQAKVAVTPLSEGDIVVSAYDSSHNFLVSKTIKAIKAVVTDSSITPSATSFNVSTPADIKVSMSLNGNSLINIMNGAAPLTKNDYTVNGNTVTLSRFFFNYYFSKFKHSCVLVFKFSGGKDAVFTVNPVFPDSSIAPQEAVYDIAAPGNISVALTLNGNKLKSVTNGSNVLVSGTDYSVSGSAITVNTDYLKKLPLGVTTLTFNFDAGKSSSLIIAVKGSAKDATITPVTDTFSVAAPNDIKVSMALNGNTLVNVMNGAAPLTKYDYAVNGDTATINKTFFNYYFGKFKNNCALTFKFSGGNDAVFTVKPVFPDSSISPQASVCDTVYGVNDIPVELILNGNKLKSVANGSNILVSGTDYSVSGSQILIKADYLKTLPLGATVLTFNFDAGKSSTLTVTIKGPAKDSLIDPVSDTFNMAAPKDMKVTMTLNGNTLVNIMNGAAPLTKYDYSVNGNVVTINRSFYNYYFGKFKNNCALTFKFSGGKDAVFTVKQVQ